MKKTILYLSLGLLMLGVVGCEVQNDPPQRPATEAVPDTPEGFTATGGFKKIDLVWEADTNAAAYILVRSIHPIDFEPKNGKSYNVDDEVASGETVIARDDVLTYSDTTTTEKINYYYKLFAVNDDKLYSSGASAYTKPHLWTQKAYVKPPVVDAGDAFGRDAAISGDTIVTSATGEDSNQTTITNNNTASSNNGANGSGAVYVLKRTDGSWAQEAYIKTPNMELGDIFGMSVDIDGDTIVASATGEDSNQTTITNGTTASSDNSLSGAGAIYVFTRDADNLWSQEAYLKVPDSDSGDSIGWSVAISGDTIVAGAYLEDSNQTTITNGAGGSANDTANAAGAAYVFMRTGTTWAQQAFIKASNAGFNDQFGLQVDIDGDTIVVGANGEDSNQTTITNGATSSADNSASSSGAAYVYKRTGSNWAQEAYLKASNAGSSDSFGVSVSISGDAIAVGAIGEASNQTTVTNGATASSDNSAGSSGAAYVFRRTGTTWVQEAYLKAPNAEMNDNFGRRVSIYGDAIAVGAYGEDSNQTTISNDGTGSSDNSAPNAGAAYVFRRTDDLWAFESYLKASNSETSDNFAYSVTMGDNILLAGASGEDSNQTNINNDGEASTNNSSSNAGALYIFDY